MSIQEELGRSLKKQAIKTGVKEGLKRVKNPKIKKGISSFLKIFASLVILRSLLSMFGVDSGSDDDLDLEKQMILIWIWMEMGSQIQWVMM